MKVVLISDVKNIGKKVMRKRLNPFCIETNLLPRGLAVISR